MKIYFTVIVAAAFILTLLFSHHHFHNKLSRVTRKQADSTCIWNPFSLGNELVLLGFRNRFVGTDYLPLSEEPVPNSVSPKFSFVRGGEGRLGNKIT